MKVTQKKSNQLKKTSKKSSNDAKWPVCGLSKYLPLFLISVLAFQNVSIAQGYVMSNCFIVICSSVLFMVVSKSYFVWAKVLKILQFFLQLFPVHLLDVVKHII